MKIETLDQRLQRERSIAIKQSVKAMAEHTRDKAQEAIERLAKEIEELMREQA